MVRQGELIQLNLSLFPELIFPPPHLNCSQPRLVGDNLSKEQFEALKHRRPMASTAAEASPQKKAAAGAPAVANPLAPRGQVPFTVVRAAPTRLLLNPLIWILWTLDFVVWLVLALLWPPKLFRALRALCAPATESHELAAGVRTRKPAKSNGQPDLTNFPYDGVS